MIGALMLRMINKCVLVGIAFLFINSVQGSCICKEKATSDQLIKGSWATSASVFGKRFRFEVQSYKLKAAPMWENPEIADPPLSRAKAIEISRSQLSNYCPEVDIWILSEIHLFSLNQGYWFWVIEWDPKGKKLGDGLSIPVLMSGEPIAGTVDDDQD
jgi:hypothetical protein